MPVDLTTALLSGGGGIVGFLGGVFQQRFAAEGRFNKRIDDRLKELEAKVEECERERPQIAILKMGVCLMVHELHERDSSNPVLKQVAAAFSTLPSDNSSFDELIKQLKQTPYDLRDAYRQSRVRPQQDKL